MQPGINEATTAVIVAEEPVEINERLLAVKSCLSSVPEPLSREACKAVWRCAPFEREADLNARPATEVVHAVLTITAIEIGS